MMGAAVLAAGLLMAGRASAGSLDPTNVPGPTMHTCEEIYQKVDTFASPKTLSAATTVVNAGYYAATTLAAVDADLTEANIKTNVTIFGIVGSADSLTYSASVPKTGQTTSYQAGDDGTYKSGVAWPNPRFTVGAGTSNNCVTDNLTRLMWLKNPDATTRNWATAIIYCEALDGTGGRGGYSDWRLPNWNEQGSLIDAGKTSPALPMGHPFTGVQESYWSSTTSASSTGSALIVSMNTGNLLIGPKTLLYYVWPVRGGQ
ncbi:MAG: DUF1566 domain-containing protein [Verrucomicrobia bacterium]|nr:DUF1566 domain-containing protein [Verrucomicrobiota bacterium]MBU4248196.1 DUF1566 domain-containing protein [Verrucomicrobiota bacterium]MBU4290130.1 DUF1566 domain-containing protein [Verrucomicrobiota bacterium]MBU4429928.1 DUF1566 domain-containing protein [Verrucomicrobiota bacterium]MBU4497298.1 DUF1566 domain-containing protein [Verrucomicrobiota bacterium]